MDEKFLEFWGNFLINFARGKKQANEASDLFQQNLTSFNQFFTGLMQQKNLKGFDELFNSLTKKELTNMNNLSEMFRSVYGLDKLSEQSSEYNVMAKRAIQDFQESFQEYLTSMGYVTKEEHIKLIEKYERLKEKCSDQEETIKHLKMLMDNKGTDHRGDVIKSLQSIIKDQTNFFQKMMSDMGQQYFGKQETTDTGGVSSSASSVKKAESIAKGEKKDDRNDETRAIDKTDG